MDSLSFDAAHRRAVVRSARPARVLKQLYDRVDAHVCHASNRSPGLSPVQDRENLDALGRGRLAHALHILKRRAYP